MGSKKYQPTQSMKTEPAPCTLLSQLTLVMRDSVIDHSARTFDGRAALHGRVTADMTRVVFIVYLRCRFIHASWCVCVCACVCPCLCMCVRAPAFVCVCVCRDFGLYVTCFLHNPRTARSRACARAQTHKQRFKHGQPVLLVAGERLASDRYA